MTRWFLSVILAPMAAGKHITLVGAGNLAQTLGPELRNAGYKVDAIVSRSGAKSRRRAAGLAAQVGAGTVLLDQMNPLSDIIWICHTDDALAETAKLLARRPGWKNKIVLHSSGALSSDVLDPLRRAGAHVASLHPMMTFVPGTEPNLKSVPFAVEGDPRAVAAAMKIARAFGAKVFKIRKESKVLYHALGSFSSPMIVATLVTAQRVGRAAGLSPAQVRKVMPPILLQTIVNFLKRGAASAFSGPIKRGDVSTVRRHLQSLARVPEAAEVYRALVRSALLDLPAANKKELKKLLG